MMEIKRIRKLDYSSLRRIATGYATKYIYDVKAEQNSKSIALELRLKKLRKPFVKGGTTPSMTRARMRGQQKKAFLSQLILMGRW